MNRSARSWPTARPLPAGGPGWSSPVAPSTSIPCPGRCARSRRGCGGGVPGHTSVAEEGEAERRRTGVRLLRRGAHRRVRRCLRAGGRAGRPCGWPACCSPTGRPPRQGRGGGARMPRPTAGDANERHPSRIESSGRRRPGRRRRLGRRGLPASVGSPGSPAPSGAWSRPGPRSSPPWMRCRMSAAPLSGTANESPVSWKAAPRISSSSIVTSHLHGLVDRHRGRPVPPCSDPRPGGGEPRAAGT